MAPAGVGECTGRPHRQTNSDLLTRIVSDTMQRALEALMIGLLVPWSGQRLAPDGWWIGGGTPQLAPNDAWVGGRPELAPNGAWVGGRPQLAPDGGWVGGGRPQLAPDGSWVGGRPRLAPDGSWHGDTD
jgi:hypothetical protein